MSIVTLINTDKVTQASNQLVYSQEDQPSLETLAEKAKHLAELLENEQSRIEASEAKAYEMAYEKGQEAGYEAALQHIAVKLIALAKDADQTRDQLERSAGDLAIKIVSRIADNIGTAETIAALAASAARQLVPREAVNLRVSVANLDNVRKLINEQPEFEKRINEVTGDPSLSGEDCILETEFGQIKANLETQLAAFREHFDAAS